MAGITVFTNAFLIDCTGKEPVEGAAVVVEGERIKDVIAVGQGRAAARAASTPRPARARRSCPASPTPTCTSAR